MGTTLTLAVAAMTTTQARAVGKLPEHFGGAASTLAMQNEPLTLGLFLPLLQGFQQEGRKWNQPLFFYP